ncbi:MAG: threonine/serine exporter family protein [Candidatus Faecousia sp.]|nr:threonine/serine exporter family protein [Candidatus Faecousia sp.]
MEHIILLDLATDLGYELAMCGAETFRVEESINRVLAAYGLEAEAFAIPNYLIVSIQSKDGTPVTRMRRIGHHGNDLDSVELYSSLSRAICAERPSPEEALRWLDEVRRRRRHFSGAGRLAGDFLGALGFGLFFGGGWVDGLCAGICGMLVGFVNKVLDDMKANPFFRTIAASFLMALFAYLLGAAGIVRNSDAVTIGALMLLVPGLLFTNAMRDIIYGDTNSGINRIVQVLLVAVAIALGTATAWNAAKQLWGAPVSAEALPWGVGWECVFAMVGCVGFSILFNIHGPGGLLCALGGGLAWLVYRISMGLGSGEILAYFWASFFASLYSEIMARIRKYPAISYLVVSIFPLIPGAGVYYTMNYAVRGEMELFASQGMHTAAIAGIMAVGILLVSTSFRVWTVWKIRKLKK